MKSLSKYPWLFHRTGTNNFKIYMELQETLNCQSNLEKKEQSWRYDISDFGLNHRVVVTLFLVVLLLLFLSSSRIERKAVPLRIWKSLRWFYFKPKRFLVIFTSEKAVLNGNSPSLKYKLQNVKKTLRNGKNRDI